MLPPSDAPLRALARHIAAKMERPAVIVLLLDANGSVEYAAFGKTPGVDSEARRLGDAVSEYARDFREAGRDEQPAVPAPEMPGVLASANERGEKTG